MKKLVIVSLTVGVLCLITTAISFSREPIGNINMVDAAGKRQGFWEITAGMMKLGSPWQPTQIVTDGNYEDSYCVGTWTEYDSNGNKVAERIYDRDQNTILVKQFNQSQLTAETYYTYKLHEHLVTFTDPQGQWKNIVLREFVKHDGPAKQYYPDGTLWVEMTWKNGRLDGPMTIYHPNGKVAEEGNWKYNWWDGVYNRYTQSGKLIDRSDDKFYVRASEPIY